MAALVDPVVTGYQSDPAGDMDRLVLLLPDDWSMVLLKPYTDELLAQVRQENETDDIDYVAAFYHGSEERFWLYNCISSLGLGLDDDGDPFLQLEFDEEINAEQVFSSNEFYVSFQEKAHTYEVFDQLLNFLDPESTAPLPTGIPVDTELDPAVYPNVTGARARRRDEGLF